MFESYRRIVAKLCEVRRGWTSQHFAGTLLGMTDLTELGAYLERHRGSLSKRKAAALADISEGRWRQVVSGRQTSGGVAIPVNPKPSTVAAMARAVGADVATALGLAGFDPDDYRGLVTPPGHDATFVTHTGSIDLRALPEDELNTLIAEAVTEKARRGIESGSVAGTEADE